MNNFLNVLALQEEEAHRVVFVKAREDGGISFIYDPEKQKVAYRVFIHNRFPYREVSSWEFENFGEARSFAARQFDADWEMLHWDQNVKRKCADGGVECGSEGTCGSGTGGCTPGNKAGCTKCAGKGACATGGSCHGANTGMGTQGGCSSCQIES